MQLAEQTAGGFRWDKTLVPDVYGMPPLMTRHLPPTKGFAANSLDLVVGFGPSASYYPLAPLMSVVIQLLVCFVWAGPVATGDAHRLHPQYLLC
jgi:hypothetical protein